MKCPRHPKYQAKREPRCDCDTCWKIWEAVEDARLGLLELEDRENAESMWPSHG